MRPAALLVVASLSVSSTTSLAVPDQKTDPEAILGRYASAYNSRDAAAVAALYAANALLLRGNRPTVRGRSAIQTFIAKELREWERRPTRLELSLVDKGADQSISYLVGNYSFPQTTVAGMFTLCLKRNERGGWEIASDMRNGSDWGYQPLQR